jgi:hypothetical protein
MSSPYQVVKGKYPTKADYGVWSSSRWLDFLSFMERHIIYRKKPDREKEEERLSITSAGLNELAALAEEVDHKWAEFFYRVGVFPIGKPNEDKEYLVRVRSMCRQALSYLKVHPALITEEMKTIMDKYPMRMGWALKQYRVINTPAGEIIQRDVAGPDGNKTVMPSFQQKMMDTMVETVDLLGVMVNSIKKSHLANDLDTKDKINAIPKLVDAINKMANRKVTPNHFTQINIHGSAKDMEESMLSYVKQKNRDNE